ncbi:MAG: aminotransferase class I/II-fold pyridoxal phosphate-dependent enzyme [Candidatus Omnitrophica bacterium]|nr:aminotransferase class I/II-fold pyridoxal phosphate-dependent enzyme [Candidatus Omnitrophota bacterium]
MFLKILLFLSPLLFSSPLLSKLEKPFPRDNFRRIKEISPQQTILKIFKTVFKDPQRAQPGSRAIAALQYGITQGDNLLRQQIAMMMKQENILADPEKNIINLHGFSEMRTILGQLFINPGDIVLYQSNSDLSERELRPFHFLGAKTIGFDFNKYLDRLEGQLKEGKVKIIYLLSDTLEGNPITLENKKLLYAIAKNYNVVIVEDASSRPKVKEKSIPLKSLDEYNRVVYLGELSYLLGEGLRLGYLLAPAEILKQIEIAKQGLTLHPNALTQVIFSEFLEHNLQLNPGLFDPAHFSGAVETFSEAEIKTLLSSKGKNMWPSEIRRILKFTQKKNIISFAGGIPAPELFPFDALVEILQNLTPQEWEEALKSAPLRGLPRLQNAIGTWLSRRGILTKFENILVTDGSQQGLDLLGRMIGEYGAKAKIITNLPTYLGALTAFMPYLSNGKEQIIHQELEKELASEEGLKKLEDFIQERKIRYGEEIFLYLTPTFGNPDGKIMPLEQRQKILSLAQRWKIKIIEDDPYGEVAWYAGYPGRRIPSLRSLDKEGETVIYLTSNSKVFSPGLRIGYVVGPEHIIARLTQIKEQTVGETDSLSQMLVAKFIENGGMDNHVQNVIIPEYKKRAETMYAVLNRHLRELDSQIEFTQPLGGLFIWV